MQLFTAPLTMDRYLSGAAVVATSLHSYTKSVDLDY